MVKPRRSVGASMQQHSKGMNLNPIVVIFTAIVFLVPGIVLFLLGFFHRKSKVDRVKVLAYVVEITNLANPMRVVFDYPLPNGQWARQTKIAAFLTNPTGQRFRDLWWIKPGYPISVYVDPANPSDVSLGAAGVPRVLAWVAMVAGGGAILMFLFANLHLFVRG